MSRSKLRKAKARIRNIRIIAALASILVFCAGYYMLFHISKSYNPRFGNTFNIVVGCAFMAVSSIVILKVLKDSFFPKKKKRNPNIVFLEDELKKQKKQLVQTPAER